MQFSSGSGLLGFAGFHSVRTRVAYGVTIAEKKHHSPERTPPFRLKSIYFDVSSQRLFKDVEIKSQHRMCLVKTVMKIEYDKRNTYHCS